MAHSEAKLAAAWDFILPGSAKVGINSLPDGQQVPSTSTPVPTALILLHE
jgi:hypothetical protein